MLLYNAQEPTDFESYQEQGDVGFTNVAGAQIDTFIYEDLSNSRERNLDAELWKEVYKVHDLAPEMFGPKSIPQTNPNAPKILQQAWDETAQAENAARLSDWESMIEPNLEALKSRFPESNIRNRDEIDTDIAAQAKVLRDKFEKTYSYADPYAAFFGTLGGAAAASMADPINIMTLPLGGGKVAGASFIKGLGIVVARGFGIGVVTETALQPFVYDYKKEIESPYDLQDALFNMAAAGVGNGLLNGAGHSIARGFDKIVGKQELPDTHETRRLRKDIQALLELQTFADETGAKTVGELEIHLKALNTAMADIDAGRQVDYDSLGKTIEAEYLELFDVEVNGARATMDYIAQKRYELEESFDPDLYAKQEQLQKFADQKLTKWELKQAQNKADIETTGELNQETDLDAIREIQKADFDRSVGEDTIRQNEEANIANNDLRASRRDEGDMIALKQQMDDLDNKYSEQVDYHSAAKKARDQYVVDKAEETNQAISVAPTDTPRMMAVKTAVNRIAASMGANDIKVRVYEGNPELDGDMRYSLADGGVSTRVPTAKASTEDALTEDLLVGADVDLADPITLAKNTEKINEYDGYIPKAANETPEEIAINFIDQVKQNLLWLHDLVPDDIRKRSHMWYTGANRITEGFAARYGYTNEQSAGVMAVLSPQKDWYMNASLGERVMDTYTNHQDTLWSSEMDLVASDATPTKVGKVMLPKGILARNDKNIEVLKSIQGKALKDLDDDIQIAAWIRVFDEAHNKRSHRIVTPEGGFIEFATTKNGSEKITGWGSFSEIAKAVSVLRDGSPKNVSDQMGAMHKVRNFYNNILLPDSPNGHVTIDTHAVAAGLIKPLSGNHTEVSHNFGTGAASSSRTGSKGTYGLYAEAYRQAASERGILARQMQSITWEAVRGMFSPAFKGSAKNQKLISDFWQSHKSGKISLDEVRQEILDAADGIEDPSWHRSSGDVADKEWSSSYKGDLPTGGISRNSELEAATGRGVGIDAARGDTSLDSGGVEGVTIKDDLSGSVKIEKDGKNVGEITYTESNGVVQIKRSDVEIAGKGIGTNAYAQFISQKIDEGKIVTSDAIVSTPAQRVYEKLKDLGFTLKKADDTRLLPNKITTLSREDLKSQRQSFGTVYDKESGVRSVGAGVYDGPPVYTIGLPERYSKSGDTIEAAINPETGELHINASAFRDEAHLMQVMREEIIGHYGLRKSLGGDFQGVINDIKSTALTNPELRQMWVDLSGIDPQTRQIINPNAPYKGMADDVIADEIISKMAREEVSDTTFMTLKNIIIKALRKIGLVKDDITISEMRALVVKSEQALKKNVVKKPTITGMKPQLKQIDEPLNNEAIDAEAARIVSDETTDQVIFDQNGNTINLRDALMEDDNDIAGIESIRVCML